MISGGQILWNAIAICDMSKNYWQTGKIRMNEDLGNLSKDQILHFVHWWNTSQIPSETKLEFINSERKYYQESFQDMLCSRENLERRHSGCWYWRIRKIGRIRNLSQKTECNRSPNNPKRPRICISCGRWFSNIMRKRRQIPRTFSETGTHRKERESQRRISRW